jgi:D-arabinose 1-dehydrogenase-like Zn-dependent alcohol dehydrogenase
MMVMDGTFTGAKYPVTGSHEPCGTVVSVGEEAGGVNVGDRVVALLPVEICREFDVSGRETAREWRGGGGGAKGDSDDNCLWWGGRCR